MAGEEEIGEIGPAPSGGGENPAADGIFVRNAVRPGNADRP